MWDDIIGRCLRWEGVARAVAPAQRGDEESSGLSSPSREKEPTPKDKNVVPTSPKSMAADLGSDVECRAIKRVVDWTFAIEEIRAKQQRGDKHQDHPDHQCK